MRATVQSGPPVTGITVLRLKVRMPDTALASVLAMTRNVGSQCAVTGVPSSTHVEPTDDFHSKRGDAADARVFSGSPMYRILEDPRISKRTSFRQST